LAQVSWSLRAADDLRDIENYIARDSAIHAIRTIDRIVEAVDILALFPMAGRMVPEYEQEEMRELIERPYRIVYLIDGDLVSVLRVVHGSRNFLAHDLF
jgi:toxin ParE1/3/4